MKINWPPQRMKNRSMMAIPIAVAAILLIAMLAFGLPMGRDFNGGTLVMVRGLEDAPDPIHVRNQVESLTGFSVDVRETSDGFDIEMDLMNVELESQVKRALVSQLSISESSIMIGVLGPAVSSTQVTEIITLGIGALIAMGVIIFIFRRRTAATAATVTAVLNTIGILGLMTIFRVPLNLSSIIGILIMLTFVLDVDALLAYRLLKGAVGSPKENAGEAMKANLAMSAIAAAALLSMALLIGATAIKELVLTLVFGVIANFANTWFLGILLIMRHVERKKVVNYNVSV